MSIPLSLLVAEACIFLQAVMLTGTPIQCNLHQLWSLLNFLYPDLFASSDEFDDALHIGAQSPRKRARRSNLKLLDCASHLLRLCMLRRLKADVEPGLPPKLETKIVCPLSRCQAAWYKRLISKIDEGGVACSGVSWQSLQNLTMQLRKVCNHPYILEDADPRPGVVDDGFIEASGKFQVFDRLLARLLDAGHRCVVFSQFTRTLDKIEALLRWRHLAFHRLDGRVGREQRNADIAAFNAPGSQVAVFLLTSRAGGLGINLQTADTCILFDSDWNPQADLQAMARVHRIGQTRVVHIYRLVSHNTVEERILQRAMKRLFLDSVVLRDQARGCNASLFVGGTTTQEWLRMLRFGADAIVESEASHRMDDAELDAIIDRCRGVDTSVGGIIRGAAAVSAAEFDATADFEEVFANNRLTEPGHRTCRALRHDSKLQSTKQSKRARTEATGNDRPHLERPDDSGIHAQEPAEAKARPRYESGDFAEVVILDSVHQGEWLACRISGPGATEGAYDIYVLPTTAFDNAVGLSGECVAGVLSEHLRPPRSPVRILPKAKLVRHGSCESTAASSADLG